MISYNRPDQRLLGGRSFSDWTIRRQSSRCAHLALAYAAERCQSSSGISSSSAATLDGKSRIPSCTLGRIERHERRPLTFATFYGRSTCRSIRERDVYRRARLVTELVSNYSTRRAIPPNKRRRRDGSPDFCLFSRAADGNRRRDYTRAVIFRARCRSPDSSHSKRYTVARN